MAAEEPNFWDDVDEDLDWLDGVEDGELSDESEAGLEECSGEEG